MRVDPAELRAAAHTISSNASGTTSGANVDGLRSGATGIGGTDTARALQRVADAAEVSIEIVRARIQSWQTVLTESAADYQGTDEQSAESLGALGDFHRPAGR